MLIHVSITVNEYKKDTIQFEYKGSIQKILHFIYINKIILNVDILLVEYYSIVIIKVPS